MSALDVLPDKCRRDLLSDRESLRADLRIIPAAEAAGWTVSFGNGHWHNAANFQKEQIHVWSGSWSTSNRVMFWVRARLDPEIDRYVDHVRFAHSMEGLRQALGLPT